MNDTNIRSDRIYALVVGIESYGDPSWNNLKGPVNDALNFTNWLLTMGVNEQNIFLHISSCKDLPERVQLDIKVDIKGASRDEINFVIDNILLNGDISGDLLYIFWSGHGFMTDSSQQGPRRRLLYSDSDKRIPKNLDVTSLLTALKSSTIGSGFRFQFCFIDACSNLIFQNRWASDLAISHSDEKARNGGQQKLNQAVLFATPLYEVTSNNNREGAGVFSKVLIMALKNLRQNDILQNYQDLINNISTQLFGKLSYETYGDIFLERKHEIPQILNFHEPCVDKEKIVKTFERMISGEVQESILLLEGHSMYGKTWLLENRFKYRIPDSMLSVKSELIGVNESIEYIFFRIINKLEESIKKFGSQKKFTKFRRYFPYLNDSEPIRIEKIKECLQVNRETRIEIIDCLLKAFCNDLKDISNHKIHKERKKIILLFDDLNNHETEVGDFLLKKFLEKICDLPKVIVVICGQANLNPYSSDVRSNCKYFNLCEDNNLIDVPTWQRFIKEYQGLGELGSSYELIEPDETKSLVEALRDDYKDNGRLLPPFNIIRNLQRLNDRKKQNL